jgi:hypothetical protein
MKKTDVTHKVDFGEVDGYSLPIIRCICGQHFEYWYEVLPSLCDGDMWECPNCHRKLAFENSITVYEIEDEASNN